MIVHEGGAQRGSRLDRTPREVRTRPTRPASPAAVEAREQGRVLFATFVMGLLFGAILVSVAWATGLALWRMG